METIFRVKGMHCASCAGIIERSLKKLKGVENASVNFGTETLKISGENVDFEIMQNALSPLGYTIEKSSGVSEKNKDSALKNEKLAELERLRVNLWIGLPMAVFSALVMLWEILAKYNFLTEPTEITMEFFHHLLPIFATIILFIIGKPYLLGIYRFFRYGKANMDTLIGIGTGTAFLYSLIVSAFEEPLAKYIDVEISYYDITIVVISLITLGKYFELKSKIKTGDAIETLLNLQAKSAIVLRDSTEIEVPVEDVKHGDLIVIKPAMKIPVDGVVVDGESFVDESMISGEPVPVEKKEGSKVVAGTLNTNGSFTFKTTKIGSETMIAHIIKMVEEAQSSKAPIQALVDKISAVFVPIILIIAFISLILWVIIGVRYFTFSEALAYGLSAFVGVLVIACPCALGLATPTAIIVGVGKGAKEGILIKDAGSLEILCKANTLVMDKTGTITNGKPEFVKIENKSELSDEKLIEIIASLEKKSEHPIASAICEYAKKIGSGFLEVKSFEIIKGKGLKGSIEGEKYFAGNEKLVKELGLKFDFSEILEQTKNGKTPIFLMTEKDVICVIYVADKIKANAKASVSTLKKMGLKIVMLSGDNENTARAVANEVGIDEVIAGALPSDKLNIIERLQKDDQIVAMAGDGINDAPALAKANIGIAMGTGTDTAIESAGITLLHGDISKIVSAIKLSKLTMNGIKQNLFWAFIYNAVGIPIASGVFFPLFGWTLSPVFAGLAMAFSSVSVVTNSLRLKAKKI